MSKKKKSADASVASMWNVLKVVSICLLAAACSDNTVVPSASLQPFGLAGTVVDSSGKRLDSVSVYCLYYSPSIPLNAMGSMRLARISEVDTFAFGLYQNFPNPFSHSTFTRFSLPRDAAITLTIKDQLDGSTRYTYMDTLLQGLYQLYLFRLVDSLQLRNGSYTCTLAAAAGSVRYNATMEMFVISDSGTPSVISSANGHYLFDYAHAFVGDSLIWTYDGTYGYTIHLTNNIFLFFRRNGYRPEILGATLFPGILLQRDVVLIRED